ncbi:MAG: NAD(+) synthase, partial [Candidatus Aenigmarchaeota archaeon]|nr:NAD(+) synthase [Candidatus Aenigmarchaeota archaeon]
MRRIYNADIREPNTQVTLREQYSIDPMSVLGMDMEEYASVKKSIEAFYRNQLKFSGADGYVIGLSGGIDSSLVATLAVDAVGADKVYGVIMPSRYSNEEDISIAVELAEDLGMKINDYLQTQSVFDPILNLLIEAGQVNPDQDIQRIKEGNIQARMRMIILRDIAKNRNCLVLGTTNRSEELMGYFTIGGDGAGGIDNEGISELYKTTEKIFAGYLGLDDKIIEKAPTAGLWEGQTDEDELGMSYENLDLILAGLELEVEKRWMADMIDREDISQEEIDMVARHMDKISYKNRPAPRPFF